MEEVTDRVLTEEEQQQLSAAFAEASGVVNEACADCSAAKLTKKKIAGAVAAGRLSLESATAIANKYAACPGLSENKICRLPSPKLQEAHGALASIIRPPKLGPNEVFISINEPYPRD